MSDSTPVPMTDYNHLSILESIQDAVIVSDLTGKIVFINKAVGHLLGYSSADLLTHQIDILIPAAVAPEEREVVERIMTGEPVVEYETQRIHKNATLLNTSVSIAGLMDKNGALAGFTWILRDLTAQKSENLALTDSINRLEVMNKELDQFAYMASHDLQEQLRNITNYVGLLDKYAKTSTDEEFIYFMSVLAQSSARMTNIIGELLTFSRIGKNRRIEQVDCGKIFRDLLLTMDLGSQEAQASIAVGPMPVIDGDAAELKLVFQHLLRNALMYKKASIIPDISVSCENNQTDWTFSIQDNGIGIKEKYFDKIFPAFSRLHAEEDYPGAGLGLAICKKVISLYKGQLWVTSTPDIGSIFYVKIPQNVS